MTHPDNSLERFLEAQDEGRVGVTYGEALSELGAGRKVNHWMWYVFPQLRGLGQSRRSSYFGITDLDEARAYLTHPVLGPRLVECAQVAVQVPDRSADEVFGTVDALKLHACATLFDLADPSVTCFVDLRWRFFSGHQHQATVDLLGPGSYMFTEAVLRAAEVTPRWQEWASRSVGPERAHEYFMRKCGEAAGSEDEMALVVLGGNNMGGGVPIDILRMLARLSRVTP